MPNRRLMEAHMRSEMDKSAAIMLMLVGLVTTAVFLWKFTTPLEVAQGVSVTCIGFLYLLTSLNRDELKLEIEKISRRRKVDFSLRLKGQGGHDGIWIGALYLDPVTGKLEPSPDPEERLLSRVRLSAWIAGERDTLMRAPRYTLDSKQMKVYLKGAEYRFDAAVPDFDYAIE